MTAKVPVKTVNVYDAYSNVVSQQVIYSDGSKENVPLPEKGEEDFKFESDPRLPQVDLKTVNEFPPVVKHISTPIPVKVDCNCDGSGGNDTVYIPLAVFVDYMVDNQGLDANSLASKAVYDSRIYGTPTGLKYLNVDDLKNAAWRLAEIGVIPFTPFDLTTDAARYQNPLPFKLFAAAHDRRHKHTHQTDKTVETVRVVEETPKSVEPQAGFVVKHLSRDAVFKEVGKDPVKAEAFLAFERSDEGKKRPSVLKRLERLAASGETS